MISRHLSCRPNLRMLRTTNPFRAHPVHHMQAPCRSALMSGARHLHTSLPECGEEPLHVIVRGRSGAVVNWATWCLLC